MADLYEAMDMAVRAGMAEAYYGLEAEQAMALATPHAEGRAALEADVEAFLARGGRITIVPPGVSALPPDDPTWVSGQLFD